MPGEVERGIMLAVGAVVLDKEGRILLVQHVEAKRGGYWFGKWICPGGKLRLGETLVDGAQREIQEETNLEVSVSRGPFVFERIVRDRSGTNLHVVYVDFVAKVSRGELKASSDAGLARWFSRKELEERWSELHEDTQRLLKMSGVLEKDALILV